ncbi:MAG: nucleotide exchange factor GrpE [Thermoplasmata archaeon]|nr:MAG: nucleotide exchange factor GrpE [Thermoplasmata archaeon]
MKIEGSKSTSDEKKEETGAQEEDITHLETLKSSLEEKDKLVREYYDCLLRSQAEFDNYKRRIEKELQEFKIYANAQLIKDLLGVLDDFQSALAVEEKGSNEKFMEGMELIYRNFLGMLEKEGLSKISAESEKFDPWKHEAVEMVPTNDYPEHTVLGVVQPGYKYKDKILRPAKVRVTTLPGSDEKKENENEKEEELDEIEDEDTEENTENNEL